MKIYPIPTWLVNAELCFAAAPSNADKLEDLALSAESAARWIDVNLIAGNRANILAARRALRMFTSIADCSLLIPPCGATLERIRSITIRLKGLVCGYM